MVIHLARYLLVLLLILPIHGTDLRENGTLRGTQGQKSSRRVVRLYSGTRPKPIECTGEGFQADPDDCTVFHRCMKNRNGRFLTFKFQCGPGTIYDPETESCNHPEQTKRKDCGGKKPIFVPNIEFDNDISKEIPSSISTRYPVISQKTTTALDFSSLQTTHRNAITLATKYPWVLTSQQFSHVPWISSTNHQSEKTSKTPPTKRQVTGLFDYSATTAWPSQKATPSQVGDTCTSEGFMGDSENCRKFYRCISNQRGGFIKYEFLCTEPTIWDEDKQACNHAWVVKRRRCGRGNTIGGNEFTFTNMESNEMKKKSTTTTSTSIQSQLQINYGSKVTQTQTQISNRSVAQNQTQINYNNGSIDNEKEQNVLQNQTQINHGNAISQTQTQINFGDNAVQTQLQIDHSKEASQAQTQINEPTSTTRTTQHHGSQETSSNTNNVCSESGFMGDSEDCKKFYRCVDNGKGGFTRYEFSCGEGTVWDPKIEACNHAWAVKECGGKRPSESTTQSTTKVTESNTRSTTSSTQNYYQSTEDDDNDIPYGNQPSSTSTSSKPPQPQPTSTKSPQSQSDNNCRSSGFMGDHNDCKKFYRCVDNGHGGYTRYEFSCGEGTVWDQKIEACNHAWAVENCGGNSGSSSSSAHTTSTQATSKDPPQNEDYDTGYGSQHDEPLQSSTTVTTTTLKSSSTTASQTTAQSPDSNTGNDCTSSGFIGDNNDCKKFYRCVDNGNGGYTRYEFTCGEGTVWDPKIEACNHAWAVEKCGGNSVDDINKVDTSTHKEVGSSSPPPSSSSTDISDTDDNNDTGYGPPSNEPQPASSSSRPENQVIHNNECKSSGFMGDNNDCKKFYRCVDNGDGTFTRHEFACGEGTLWDQSIETCNHAWAVKGQCSQSDNNIESNNNQSTTQSTESETESEDQGYNEPTSQKPNTSSQTSSTPTGNKCTQDGFYGDENNCKNFFRCVDNGQGGFTKYEFSCGDGTVWNQDILACDHETENKKCSAQSLGSTSSKPNSENDEMIPEYTTKETTTTTSSSDNNHTSQTPQLSKDKCENEGFYGDSNDCKKFYRCVDDGKGGFTKYDFTCGDGTIWEQEILACNHESSDKKCTTTVGNTSTTSSSSETSLVESTTNNHEQQTTRPMEVTTSGGHDHCEMEGFFANSQDCKKFYRCVDDGKEGFTKYDFSCGEGTIWVQEILACDYDNDISNCSHKDTASNPQTTQTPQSSATSSSSQYTTQSQMPDKEDDEYSSGSTSKPSTENEECTTEGFYGSKNDCTRFYRCVDNGKGGYIKYDLSCGEGTAWDSNIQTCNHISEVESCQNSNQQGSSSQPSDDENSTQSSQSSSVTKDDTSTESSKPSSSDECNEEGYFGDTKDCTKFYRCVDNGKGGFTKYDFSCGEGTIWDQDVTTCNHPQDVANPSCRHDENSQTGSSSSTEDSGPTSSSSATNQSLSTDESNNQSSSNCSQESTTKKPTNQKVKCEKAGYYPDPDDCKKFYRCVDWDGDGQKFSVYHFECGEGTIWDPQLETCNHEDSVYPPRDCSGSQSQSEKPEQETTTTEKSTTVQETTTTESTTTQSTEESTTTEKTKPTTQESTTKQTTQQSTTEKTTTQEMTSSTTTQKSTTEQTTTEQPTTTQEQTTQESTTSEQSTTSENTTTQKSTTEQSTTTTEQSTTSELTTTQQSTTSEPTTQQSTTSEQTTQQSSTSEQTTETSTTTEQSTTENDNSTTESSTTTTTDSSEMTTSESGSTPSEETSSSEKECPGTEDDQYLYVCPTSFRRHPKYCNMFYQCTEDNNSHEVKIATFKCPNNTIYDEKQSQCVEEDKADKKCNGQIAQKYRVKRLNPAYKEPIEVSRNKHTCSTVGYHPFEKDSECSGAFLKCQKTKTGKLRGYVHRCPEGFLYWSISKRCEKQENMKGCKQSINNWKNRWEIPVEKKNIDK